MRMGVSPACLRVLASDAGRSRYCDMKNLMVEDFAGMPCTRAVAHAGLAHRSCMRMMAFALGPLKSIYVRICIRMWMPFEDEPGCKLSLTIFVVFIVNRWSVVDGMAGLVTSEHVQDMYLACHDTCVYVHDMAAPAIHSHI